MAKRNAVNPQELLDLVVLAAEVVIPAIDARLVDIKGTQAARLKLAAEAVDEQVNDLVPYAGCKIDLNELTVPEVESVLSDYLAELAGERDRLAKMWLQSNKSTTAAEAEGLRTVRAEHVKNFDSFVNALTQLGWFDDEDPAPVLPKVPGSSGGGGKATSTTIAGLDYQYWYELNGTRTNLNGIQNKFSSLGFYAGAKAKVGTVPAALINSADTKAHSKNHSEAWSATVDYQDNSFTFGMDIVGDAKS